MFATPPQNFEVFSGFMHYSGKTYKGNGSTISYYSHKQEARSKGGNM